MVFALEVLRSERIFWKSRVRKDLLGEEMSIGKRVCNSLSIYELQDESNFMMGIIY